MEFELTYDDSAVQCFNHYTTGSIEYSVNAISQIDLFQNIHIWLN